MTKSNGPSESRRQFLRHSLATVSAVAVLGQGAGLGSVRVYAADAPEYHPTYFNPAEWAFLSAAVERLIPSNEDGPGAVELGVPEFLDRQMQAPYGHGGLWYMKAPFITNVEPTLGYQLPYTPRELYRLGIAATDAWCKQSHGSVFAKLSPRVQDDVLQQLEAGKIDLKPVPSAAFFKQLLTNTKEGYFADPIHGGNRGTGSWKMIGFPGARADFADFENRPGVHYPFGPVSISGKEV